MAFKIVMDHCRIILIALALSGCANQIECAVRGDNASGRITFSPSVEVSSQAQYIVSAKAVNPPSSSAPFTVSDDVKRTITNRHGLLSMPYTICLKNGIDYQVKVHQDINQNGVEDSGDYAGRHDLQPDGDSAYLEVKVNQITEKIVDGKTTKDWPKVDGVDVIIDTKL